MEQTIIPDTHSFVKEMAAAGMPQPVAEAFVKNYTKYLLGNLATKQDIQNSEQAMKTAVAPMKTKVAPMETKLTRAISDSQLKIILSLAGYATLLAALSKFL